MGQLVSDIDKPDIVRIARIAGWEGEDLWSNIDIRPGGFPRNLDPV